MRGFLSTSLWMKEMQMGIRLRIKRRNTRTKCWEVKVVWWALRHRAGDSTLPLSCIYPLATVRRVGFVDRGLWGELWGALRERKSKMSEMEREMYWILMSAHSPAEWRATDPCLCTHLYTGWKAAIFDYFTLHLSLMSSRCSLQQLHTYLGEQRGAFRHIWLWQKPLFAVCCWCKLFHHIGHISFHTDVEPSARCCPLFHLLFVIRAGIIKLPSSCAVKTEKTLSSGMG